MTATPSRGAGQRTRRRTLARAVAAALAIALAPTIGLVGAPAPAAYSAPGDYPSWEDVKQAKQNEAAAKALQGQLEAQLKALEDEVARTQAEAQKKGEEYYAAQQAYDEQVIVTQNLLDQASAAQEKASAAYERAAVLIAQLSKTGGDDVTTRLFGATGSPDALLRQIQTSDLISGRNGRVYEEAKQLQNIADSLGEQAAVAQTKLDELRIIAEQKFQEAQAAAEAAQRKFEETQVEIAEVRARVEYLAGIREQTIADYNAGLAAQWGSGAGGELSASGWARPAAGYISSHFGNRLHPIYGYWRLHTGVDLAGQGCGAPIRAAHMGTVVYAGWSGDLGNFIEIQHPGGIRTGYAHIQNGGIGVHIGQEVGSGQHIARVGTTGGSTGCHLHFMVRVNGNLTDPVTFLRNQGISLG